MTERATRPANVKVWTEGRSDPIGSFVWVKDMPTGILWSCPIPGSMLATHDGLSQFLDERWDEVMAHFAAELEWFASNGYAPPRNYGTD